MKRRSIRFHSPTVPTDALPGSKEKIRILAERVRLGVSLWHPLDAKQPGDTSRPHAGTDRWAGIVGEAALNDELSLAS